MTSQFADITPSSMRKLQLFINKYYFQVSWGYFLINEVGQWFYQLYNVTFSKNVFWSVNFVLPFCQIYYGMKTEFT